MVHPRLWDYDLPAAPNLIDVRVNGTPVKAVAQVSKQGFVYVSSEMLLISARARLQGRSLLEARVEVIKDYRNAPPSTADPKN
jgi:hypothetical protein